MSRPGAASSAICSAARPRRPGSMSSCLRISPAPGSKPPRRTPRRRRASPSSRRCSPPMSPMISSGRCAPVDTPVAGGRFGRAAAARERRSLSGHEHLLAVDGRRTSGLRFTDMDDLSAGRATCKSHERSSFNDLEQCPVLSPLPLCDLSNRVVQSGDESPRRLPAMGRTRARRRSDG